MILIGGGAGAIDRPWGTEGCARRRRLAYVWPRGVLVATRSARSATPEASPALASRHDRRAGTAGLSASARACAALEYRAGTRGARLLNAMLDGLEPPEPEGRGTPFAPSAPVSPAAGRADSGSACASHSAWRSA